MKYFPNKFPAAKGPARCYFFNILNTLKPDYVKGLLEHANKLRMEAGVHDSKLDYIDISETWYEKLKSSPFVSRKYYSTLNSFVTEHKGKLIHLLKSRSKATGRIKKRRKIELGCSIEEHKQEEKPIDVLMEVIPQPQTLVDKSDFKDITSELKFKSKIELMEDKEQ